MKFEYYDWKKIDEIMIFLVDKIKKTEKTYTSVIGVERGGIIPAVLLARKLGIDRIKILPYYKKRFMIDELPLLQDKPHLIVDEIYDTGDTYFNIKQCLNGRSFDFAFLLSKKLIQEVFIGKVVEQDKWIIFPWEDEGQEKQIIR